MVAQGVRRIVLVQGEAGMGKSRLLHTMKERLIDQSHAICELHCFPEFSQSPFHPLITMLEAIFGFEHRDETEMKFDKLVKYLQVHYPVSTQDTAPLLSQLLSLPLTNNYPAPSFSPQILKERTNAVLLDMLQVLATQQPVLLIVEDLHWIDPSTLELLILFVEQIGRSPILAVLTARPEFSPPWHEGLNATLALAPLIDGEVTKMIASLSEDIPAETILRIVERADGVPLFAEEMAKIASQDKQASIPATLHDLLAARMDSMGEAKYTAQLAATLGREFDLEVLRKVFPHSAAMLARTLSALQDAGLVLKVNESACQFKHALIQEAAYHSQTSNAKQIAHKNIAHTLQNDFIALVINQPERLALHLSAGGEVRQSIEYWIKAGKRAAHSSANAEAVEHFNRGLQLLLTLSHDRNRDRLESELCINLGTTLIAIRGYGSVEAGGAYTRAFELAEQLGDSSILYQTLWGMWLTSSSRIGHSYSLEIAEKLLHSAEHNNDQLQRQQAHYAMGNSCLWIGDLVRAHIHLERSIALYQPSHHQIMIDSFGENICVSSCAQLSWVLWLQGFQKQADEASQRAVALAQQINHPYSLCYAKAHDLALGCWMKRIETTLQGAQEIITLSNQHGFPLWLLSGASIHGWALSMQGQESGLAYLQQGVATVRAAMSGIEVYFLSLMGEAYMALGQFEAALSVMDNALNVIDIRDARFLESEIFRLKGICLLEICASNTIETENCFKQALAISRRQGAKSLELRAAISLAKMWQRQGRQEDARHVLEGVYNLFTEGFGNSDLQEARMLLDTL
ncbi:AAA family ATPase [Methylobacter svalbardensis]|uniref:AAA family ATPase n=1 Tax=Methylobacter svalbardensis TaxID=3080016 RepID=UPI0030EC1E96